MQHSAPYMPPRMDLQDDSPGHACRPTCTGGPHCSDERTHPSNCTQVRRLRTWTHRWCI